MFTTARRRSRLRTDRFGLTGQSHLTLGVLFPCSQRSMILRIIQCLSIRREIVSGITFSSRRSWVRTPVALLGRVPRRALFGMCPRAAGPVTVTRWAGYCLLPGRALGRALSVRARGLSVPPWRRPSVTARQCKAVVTRISRRDPLARLVMSRNLSSWRARLNPIRD